MAPSVGNCLVPILVGYLCTIYTGDIVVMIYGAIIMQNCVFIASFSRPIYIEKVIRHTYNKIRDVVEDDDEVIFSNQNNASNNDGLTNTEPPTVSVKVDINNAAANDEDATDVVVFKSKKDAKEIIDPSVEFREKMTSERRFSSDFGTVFDSSSSNRFSSDFGSPSNRFSSDFGTLDVGNYNRISGYQELESIERGQNPQPLYRETTVNAPQNSIVFAAEITPGTARRTATLKKNLITITNMLRDMNFYLYALLHLTTTFSILVLGVVFPPLVWEQNPTLNIWSVSVYLNNIVSAKMQTKWNSFKRKGPMTLPCGTLSNHLKNLPAFEIFVGFQVASVTAVAHGSALCFIMLCVVLPKSINEKERLCGAFCLTGAIGFYGKFNHTYFMKTCDYCCHFVLNEIINGGYMYCLIGIKNHHVVYGNKR